MPAPAGEDRATLLRLESDADTTADAVDAFPGNPAETSDGDGIGDNQETAFGLDPGGPADADEDAGATA